VGIYISNVGLGTKKIPHNSRQGRTNLMLVMPQKFDSNEWFILTALIVGYGAMFIIPKRLPLSYTLLIMSFSLAIVKLTDHILGAPPLELYDFNDTPKFDLFDLLIWFLYPVFGYVFIYLYEKWSIKGIVTFLYIFTWSWISLFIEWWSLEMDVFTFKGWKFSYSYPFYVFILSVYLLFFKFIKNYKQKNIVEK
jgi:hypothetical protein